jgi:hypothetical protein
VFEKAEHASKAVKEKTGNAVFPRQRYVWFCICYGEIYLDLPLIFF